MKTLTVLFVLIIICIIGIAAGTSKSFRDAPRRAVGPPQQSADMIDGAVHPELVPDRVAYTLLFRLIANRQTEEEKGRIRAYIRQMGVGDTDINTLLAVAEEFQQRVGVLDKQAREIKAQSRNNTNPIMAELLRLQRQKEAIVDEIVASLPHRMSADSMEKVQQHINEHVKRNVKLGASHNP